MRILVLSAAAGTGHVRAGDALAGALREAGAEAAHVEVLGLAPRWVCALYGRSFELLASRAPGVWRVLYEQSDGERVDRARWGPVAARTLFRRLRRLLGSRRWDYCLCTHFLPAQLLAGRGGAPPFGLVVTDFGLHRYWMQPRVQDCFVATPALAQAAALRLPRARVRALGIPTDPSFARLPAREAARRELGLDPGRPVALVAGGGLGLGLEAAVGAALGAEVPGLQLVVVCGRNVSVRDRLERWGVPADRLRVVGYTHAMDRWMAAADVVVTKPGGLTTSEALVAGRPLILTRPVPGHEQENARVLVGAEAALAAEGGGALRAALVRFFGDPALRERLAAGGRRLAAPDAARAIVGAVLERGPARAVA